MSLFTISISWNSASFFQIFFKVFSKLSNVVWLFLLALCLPPDISQLPSIKYCVTSVRLSAIDRLSDLILKKKKKQVVSVINTGLQMTRLRLGGALCPRLLSSRWKCQSDLGTWALPHYGILPLRLSHSFLLSSPITPLNHRLRASWGQGLCLIYLSFYPAYHTLSAC